MIKKTLKNIKLIVLAMVLAVGMSYLGASATWVGPSTTPPGANRSTPVNVLSSDQTKEGAISIGYDAVAAAGLDFDIYKLRVNGANMSKGIYSEGDFTTADSAFVGTVGDDGVDRSVSVGGRIGVHETSPAVSLHVNIFDNATIRTEAFPSAGKIDAAGGRELCADSEGDITLCEDPFNVSLALTDMTTDACMHEKTKYTLTPHEGITPYTYTFDITVSEPGDYSVTGTGATRTVTYQRSELGTYTANVHMTATDGDGSVDVVNYSTTITPIPEGIGADDCAD